MIKLFKMFINFLFLAALGLHCCAQASSSCGEKRILFSCSPGVSCGDGFFCSRARALGCLGSVVAMHALQ